MMEIFPRRRWLRRLAVGAVTVGAVVLALYGWAFLSLDRSSPTGSQRRLTDDRDD